MSVPFEHMVEEEAKRYTKESSAYRHALEKSSVVAIIDLKGTITYANDNLLHILKYTREELTGQSQMILNAAFYTRKFMRELWLTSMKGNIWQGTVSNKTKDGNYYSTDTTIAPFLDDNGTPYQYLVVHVSSTDRSKVEELTTTNGAHEKREGGTRKSGEVAIQKLKELEQRVTELTTELKCVNNELELLSYSISHDLRAPLRSVSGYSLILEEDYGPVIDQEGRQLLHIIQDSAKKMNVLIDGLLVFSRMGRKAINRSAVNMNKLVRKVIHELRDIRNLPVVQVGNLHSSVADCQMMEQVWTNILSNAIKYSSNTDDPLIIIRSENKNGMHIYSVTDNGVGFDMLYADKLFGVFQQLHNAEDFEGSGIGLALAHRIITKHGGRIWANAEPGKGATFSFSLPARTIKTD